MTLRSTLLLITVLFSAQGLDANQESSGSYRLYPLDVISLAIYGEPSLSTQLRLSGDGAINIPLIGNLTVGGLTLAEAEARIAETYIEREIFISPQVTLQVSEYSKKEISFLGQISRQGKIVLPPETTSLSIIEAVSAAGGFNRIAKADSVRISRKDPSTGEEKIYIVDVESMIEGKNKDGVFFVLPGDIVFIPERLF